MKGLIFVSSIILVLAGVGTIETSETLRGAWAGFTASGLGIAGLLYVASDA